MDFMPFMDISDKVFLELFPRNYDIKHDSEGEWIHMGGLWHLVTRPPERGEWAHLGGWWAFGEWFYLTSVGWRFEPCYTDQEPPKGEWAYLQGEWIFGEWVGRTFMTLYTDQVYDPLDYPPLESGDYDSLSDLD
jgi:hypothetical protein